MKLLGKQIVFKARSEVAHSISGSIWNPVRVQIHTKMYLNVLERTDKQFAKHMYVDTINETT